MCLWICVISECLRVPHFDRQVWMRRTMKNENVFVSMIDVEVWQVVTCWNSEARRTRAGSVAVSCNPPTVATRVRLPAGAWLLSKPLLALVSLILISFVRIRHINSTYHSVTNGRGDWTIWTTDYNCTVKSDKEDHHTHCASCSPTSCPWTVTCGRQ